MMKTLLTSALLLAASLSAFAQAPQSKQLNPGLTLTPKAVQQAPAKDAGQGSIEFTYFEGSKLDVFGLGWAKEDLTYDVAMQIPADYAGYKVTAVSFILFDATILDNVQGWVNASLPSSASSASVHQATSERKSYNEGYTKVTLPTEFTVPADGCYAGYSFTLTSAESDIQYAAGYPILTDFGSTNGGGFYMKASSSFTSWIHSFKDMGYNLNSTIMVTLKGAFQDNEVYVNSQDLGTRTAVVGQKRTFDLGFTGNSLTPVNSLSYTVTDVATGAVSEEQTVGDLGGVEYTKAGNVPVTVEAGNAVGDFEKVVTITKVNGVANANTNNKSTLTLHVLSKALNKKVFEEEFTTTDCGWCPFGIVGMQLCEEALPDNWVGVAAHGLTATSYWEDPMYQDDYYNLPAEIKSFQYPSCQLDRKQFSLSPYYGAARSSNAPAGIIDDIKALLEEYPDAKVDVSAKWEPGANVITVTAETEFAFDYKYSPYALGFVLVGNGLTGTTKNWYQYNYFPTYGEQYGYDKDANLVPLIENQTLIKDQTYNHVALLTQGLVSGVEGSIASPVKSGQKQTFTTTFDLTDGIYSTSTGDDDNLLQDKTKLQVVAFIVNEEEFYVINADKCDITGYETGIASVADELGTAGEVARYNAAGQQISAPQKGINIVKLANGTTRKVVVK